MNQLPVTIICIYYLNWFPEYLVTITEIPSEIIQKVKIDHNNIEIKNYNAKNQSFVFKHITENTNTSLESSAIENIGTMINSQRMSFKLNETTETDFNSTLLDDGKIFFISYCKSSFTN